MRILTWHHMDGEEIGLEALRFDGDIDSET